MWFFIISNTVLSDSFYRVGPWQLSILFDRFVFSDVWSKFDSVCNGLVSASGSAEMLSAAILSAVATIQILEQFASEGGLRAEDYCKRSSAQTVASMDNQR